ncbi:uncharacterized protein SCHCODRAFT_02664700 [Schizophyllum commune H4-8]|nr:uncharacterized protein SCHCODRAFT_02664700 [Schizophyllum commune H4-8]KAI5896952.1 hypothetical protein SCHCODRAFT_02664700 [Schizophyllum commune H4-8]
MYRSWSSDNSSSGGQSRRASTADQSADDEGIIIRQLLDETAPGSQMQEIFHPTRAPGLNVRIWAIVKPEYRTLSTSQFPWEAILFADDHCGELSGVPPIHRLPARSLSEIFLNCAEWHAGSMHELSFSGNSVPFVLSAVCGLWRDVALHVPELWRSMFLRPCQGRGHQRMANLFLQRARGRFLYIGYSESSDAGSAVAGRCTWAIDFIRQNLRQIICLHLDDITDRTVSRLAGLSSGCAPALASLHVKMRPGQCSQESMQILASLCTGSPRLVTLDWHASVFPLNVHWPQITRIELKHCPVDSMTVLHIIQSAVLLRALDINITLAPRLPNSLSVLYPAVRNASLKKLAIASDGWA